MKKLLIIVFLAITSIAYSQEKTKELQSLENILPAWQQYADSCANDSTLIVYWEYTGKEQFKPSTDTIQGIPVKVLTKIPTQRQVWNKETPNMEGFKKYLERKK